MASASRSPAAPVMPRCPAPLLALAAFAIVGACAATGVERHQRAPLTVGLSAPITLSQAPHPVPVSIEDAEATAASHTDVVGAATASIPADSREHADQQLGQAIMFGLFYFPVVTATIVSVWLRLRRGQRLALAAATGEKDPVHRASKEEVDDPPNDLKRLAQEIVSPKYAQESGSDGPTPDANSEGEGEGEPPARDEDDEDAIRGSVERRQSKRGQDLSAALTDTLKDRMSTPEIQALLQNYFAKAREVEALREQPGEQADDLEASRDQAAKELELLGLEVKLLEGRARETVARERELREELEATERLLAAVDVRGGSEEAQATRRVAALSIGGIAALQLLRSLLGDPQQGPEGRPQNPDR